MKNGQRMATYSSIVIAVTVLVGGVFLHASYRRDIRAAYRRLEGLERQTTDTSHGELEYAVRGEGYPVLVVHGAAGGFDQGLDLAAEHLGEGLKVIAPSRFGYLGTPLPPEANPTMQADAFVCLLDELGIQQAAVIATSAGGPSAVQLALRYPERVSALVLISTAVSDKPMSLPPKPVIQRIVGSDFVFWLLAHPLRSTAQRMFVPSGYQLTPMQDAEVAETIDNLLPISPRAPGLFFDIFVTNTDPHERSSDYRLERITVPTLVVNAKDDPAASYEDAREMSRRIPEAKFKTIQGGGHLMVGSGDVVRTEVCRFLKTRAENTASMSTVFKQGSVR